MESSAESYQRFRHDVVPSLVRMVIPKPESALISINEHVYDFFDLASELSTYGLSAVWIDWQGALKSDGAIRQAFGVGLRWYLSPQMEMHWDAFTDDLCQPAYLPRDGCLLYFSQLASMEKDGLCGYRTLLQVLTDVARYWDQQGYYFRTMALTQGLDLPSFDRDVLGKPRW